MLNTIPDSLIKDTRQKIQEFIPTIDEKWRTERRLEYINGQIAELEECYKRMTKANYPFWFIKVIWKLRKGDKWLKLSKFTKSGKSNGITDAMIDQARSYPVEDLIKTNRNGFARCINPAHDDKHPSMLVKNGYVYCFSCLYKADSIAVYMQLAGVNFPEAVRALSGWRR